MQTGRNANQVDGGVALAANERPRSRPVIARNVFTTAGLEPSRQFDAYREYCAPVIEISPTEKPGAGWDACCEMWQLGPFGFRRIRTPAACFGRRETQVRRDGLDHWVFNVVRHGNQEARTASSELRTGAGELSVFSLAGAYEARRTHIDWVGLFVPRGTLAGVDASLNHRQHRPLDNASGRLLATYLVALADELPSIQESELPHAIQVMQALVEGSVESLPVAAHSNDTALDVPRMRLLRDIINSSLGSWNLHAGRLCRLAHISRSNLYRMFEPYGGVVHYIQRQRLRRAHALLADPTCTRKIGQIANDYCFSDASTFSRAFRQEFGYSPMDLRRHAETGGGTVHLDRRPRKVPVGGSWDLLFNS